MIKDNNDGTFSIVAPCSFDKPKPVAWMNEVNDTFILFSANKPPEDAYDEGSLVPLYTAQEYKNPTTEEVMQLWLDVINNINANDKRPHEWHFACALLKKASGK